MLVWMHQKPCRLKHVAQETATVVAYQYDGFVKLAVQRYQRVQTVVQGIYCSTANSDRHQKGVGRAIRGCSTQSRDKLLVMTTRLQVD